MSAKIKQAIAKCMIKIENDTFDEDTIRTLLIVSREHIEGNGLIRELAHFIAHNDRNQGMFHKKVNARYTKFKLFEQQSDRANFTEIAKTFKTEDEYSDYMLSAVSIQKINSKLFHILYSDGLDDLPEEHLKQYTGFTKAEATELLQRHYIKKNGFHYLTTRRTEYLINEVKKLGDHTQEKEAELEESLRTVKELADKIERRIDGVQKVIRGAIHYTAVFETDTFKNEIETAIRQVLSKFEIDDKYLLQVNKNSDDILLCVMTLLHDSTFTFYDKEESRNYLGFYLDHNSKDDKQMCREEAVYHYGYIALYISGMNKMSYPLFVSDLPVKRYLSYEAYKCKPAISNFSESGWITAGRVGNNLQLINDTIDET
ncbi:MAG: hypothetical protein WC623_15340 [Pedobacter sp.]|uniref:hypothetical protein n=1 Tax=Pedobacter sp. TaxID=1411316 RepID=UPI0035637918